MREVAQWHASRPEIGLIFEGNVTAQELKAGNLNSALAPLSLTATGRYRIVHFASIHVYRGQELTDVVLRTGLGTSDCGYPFETGATYLVFASKAPDGTWVTSICHGTEPIQDAAIDTRFLKGLPPSPDDLMAPREYQKRYAEEVLPKRTGSICEFVMHQDGTPLQGARVELYELRSDGLPPREAGDPNTSAENGHFCIERAEPARYLLTVENDAYDRNLREMAYYPGVRNRSEAVPLEMRPGEKLPDVTIKTFLEPLYTIRVRVVTSEGSILTENDRCGVLMKNSEQDSLSYDEGFRLDENGISTFSYVPSGRYTTSTFLTPPEAGGEPRPSSDASRCKPSKKEVTIVGNAEVEIRMEPEDPK